MALDAGARARLHRVVYQSGPLNAVALSVPHDQGRVQRLRDSCAGPGASDPGHIARLTVEEGFTGIAIQIAVAERFYWDRLWEILAKYPRGRDQARC
jgi:class I fructose-bisphosphate aldolase